jgi:acetyl-CoA C-acetyltransferase
MKTIVVAGWGQVTQPKEIEYTPKDPMGLMKEASLKAGQKLADPNALARVDGIMVVKSLSTHYDTPGAELAALLGASPKFLYTSKIGGNSPQTLINKAAGMIARNELDSILVVGAEAYVQRSENQKNFGNSRKSASSLLQGIPKDYSGDDIAGSTPLENFYGIEDPMQGFPLFETALWAASGLSLTDYLHKIASLWSGFSKVAASHPNSWSKTIRTPEEIITPGPHNRPIAFPYNKFMNAFVTVDQGAAVILMSGEAAKKHCDKARQIVYFLGGGYAEDRQRFMIQKTDFTASPPLKVSVDKALHRSGLNLSDIDCFDLYSCFPCAISIARKMMGISENDPRPTTLTGGLGFFGGPGNNYNLHAVATLAEMISQGHKKTGLVTALGWFMHKHAAGIYSSMPPQKHLETIDLEDEQNYLTGLSPLEIDDQARGRGIIETYTIVYDKDRSPSYAVLYGKTSKGLRFIARTLPDPEIFQLLSSQNMVGESVTLRFDLKNKQTIGLF